MANVDLDVQAIESLEPTDPSQVMRAVSADATVPVDTILKKAFTGFHNSQKFGQDNVSAYLGDESSVHRNFYFAPYPQSSTSVGLRPSPSNSSLRMLNIPKPALNRAR